MKKNVLALSIAAMVGGLGFAGAASAALSVNESGTGHILMVPYYTAQNGNMTVFHLTNTDTLHGKAVKVRFRGASNSDDVLDFQVFMSPGDVWTAAVTADANGLSQLVTADNTCTLPRISAGTPVKFVTDRLAKTDWTASDKAAQTREGYVEILNMADIPDNNGDKGLFKAIKHVNGVAPCTSGILNATLSLTGVGPGATNLNLPNNTAADLTVPTGGLTGSWYVMNVAQTTTFSGATPAIVASGATRNVFSHQKTGTALLETADPLMVGGAIPTQHYDVPDLSTPYEVAATTAAAQASDLTTAIARTSVINQYATDASISAKTDWVFSMPTRRYTIAANYAAGAVNQVVGNVTGTSLAGGTVTVPAGSAAAYRFINNNIPVANNIFRTAGNTTVNNAGQICVEAQSQTFYDREERFQEDGAIFSPGTISKTQLCGEVSVLAFSADTSALAASVARQNVAAPYTNGWGVVNFNAPTPLLGAAFLKLTNPQAAPGTSGTYGITWPHAYR